MSTHTSERPAHHSIFAAPAPARSIGHVRALSARRCSACAVRDDAASLASRSSAVIFLLASALRLVALDIFLRARQWLLQFMRAA